MPSSRVVKVLLSKARPVPVQRKGCAFGFSLCVDFPSLLELFDCRERNSILRFLTWTCSLCAGKVVQLYPATHSAIGDAQPFGGLHDGQPFGRYGIVGHKKSILDGWGKIKVGTLKFWSES